MNIKGNKSMEYPLAGFDKLSAEDKKTIEHLIIYFNKNC